MSDETASGDKGDGSVRVAMAADIVSAYIGHNTIGMTEISGLIETVHAALSGLDSPAPAEEALKDPADSIRTSVKPDRISCIECGKSFKSLKRHLRTHHDLTPEEYRSKWSLRHDYPMVAPEYAEARSNLAKQMGLGQKGRQRG